MHQRKTLLGVIVLLAVVCLAGSQLIVHAAGGNNVPAIPPVNFAPPVDYTVGTLPFANAVADFNGDHILDVAVVNYSSNNVSVLFGKGDGTFEPAVNYTVGTEPTAITAIDLNGDGVPDIAVADEIGKTIAVLINNADGTGTFKPAVLYPAGQAPRGIAAGDLRGIGKIDLVVANNLGGNVSVFLGNGDGTFQPAVNYNADVNPKSVALGDFNMDGHLDIACANHNTNDVSILLGNGDGTFKTAVNYPTGIDPRHVLAYDFNKDGKLDLAVANGGESTVSILYGNGDGTFQPQAKYTANTSPRWLAVADYNNDGFLDIATSNYDAKNVSILLGTGSSVAGQAFLPNQDYIVGNNPTGLAAGDFNGDGLPDIAVTVGGLPTVPNTIMAVLLNIPVTVSPTSLTFPTQVLGTTSAPQAVTLTNGAPNSLTISSISITGTDPKDFSQTNNCGTALSGNASCTINVVFNPTSVNNRTATLTIVDSAPGGAQTVALTGVATAVNLSPTSLTFASQNIGTTSAPQVVTLTNASGGSTITITSLVIGGTNTTDFAQTNTCGTSVLPLKSCTISVTFTPTATGARSATVSITDNAGSSPQTVPLSGTGAASVTVTPANLTYKAQVLKTTSAAQVVTVTNNGTTAVGISSIAISGSNATDYAQTNNCGTSLAGSSNCTINVTFTPSSINRRIATLTITDDAGTQTVNLSGTGTAASITPKSLAFAAQTVGTTSAPQTVTFTNASGATTITITSIKIAGTDPGDFAQTNTCGTSVLPKKSCTISVTFKPTVTGARSAAVSITDNAGASPQLVPLVGTGK
jgi:FG-GAP-like repeat/Abnormal spindle-like microcephaly-assoc'd, ASPM-SPD-2-Hydin/FG-GAP repeat